VKQRAPGLGNCNGKRRRSGGAYKALTQTGKATALEREQDQEIPVRLRYRRGRQLAPRLRKESLHAHLRVVVARRLAEGRGLEWKRNRLDEMRLKKRRIE